MKVELAQLAGRDNDTAYNLERALAAIAACAADTQLIMFPEGHLMGFPSAQTVAQVAEPLDGPTVSAVLAAARVGPARPPACRRAWCRWHPGGGPGRWRRR